MFLKQTTYKPRSNSGSNPGGQQFDAQGSPKEEKTKVVGNTDGSPVTAAAAGRRRSSASSGAYAGLNSYKRNSQDGGSGGADASARKASWAEQKQGSGGILSNAWNSFTKGS